MTQNSAFSIQIEDNTPNHRAEVKGKAILSGKLKLENWKNSRNFAKGECYSILLANSISGKFSNPDDKVIAKDGTIFSINYGEKEVSLTVIGKQPKQAN